jgi:hypothetical protein
MTAAEVVGQDDRDETATGTRADPIRVHMTRDISRGVYGAARDVVWRRRKAGN